jgi:hypothetical protein
MDEGESSFYIFNEQKDASIWQGNVVQTSEQEKKKKQKQILQRQ